MNAPVAFDAALPPTQPMDFSEYMDEFRAMYREQLNRASSRELVPA